MARFRSMQRISIPACAIRKLETFVESEIMIVHSFGLEMHRVSNHRFSLLLLLLFVLFIKTTAIFQFIYWLLSFRIGIETNKTFTGNSLYLSPPFLSLLVQTNSLTQYSVLLIYTINWKLKWYFEVFDCCNRKIWICNEKLKKKTKKIVRRWTVNTYIV